MANNDVYTGFWVDHSKGPVLGATITLESKWGVSIIAAAAIVIQIVGVSLWKIIAFLLHQHFSTPHLRDESDAQRQVILRNTAGPSDAAWNILALGKTWRGRKPKVMRNATLLSLVPGMMWVGFIAAGVLVGRIASDSYDNTIILKKSGLCGFVGTTRTENASIAIQQNNINTSIVAQQYSRSCYEDTSSSAVSCSVYPTRKLLYNVSENQPCPVPDGACFDEPENMAIKLASGPMDTHDDLGINAPKSDRLTFEYQWTCAPLLYDFVNAYRKTERLPNFHNLSTDKYLFATSYKIPHSGQPFFHFYPIIDRLAKGGKVGLDYALNVFGMTIPWNDSKNFWRPEGPFRSVQGDLSILLLMPNGILYSEPVHDPMFRTHPKQISMTRAYRYESLRTVYAMACSSLYQICNPSSSNCTGFQVSKSFLDVIESESSSFRERMRSSLQLNEQQYATLFRLIVTVIDSISPYKVLVGLGDPLLASTYQTTHGFSSKLPNGQWKQEVIGWFTTSLAKIQYLTTSFVNVGFSTASITKDSLEVYPAKNFSRALAAQCGQQRVACPVNYTNYNFFALVFISFFGLVIPITASVMRYLHNHAVFVDPNSHRYLSYQAEGYLELHRLVLESAGYGGWTHSPLKTPRTNQAKERIPQIQKMSEGGDEAVAMLCLPTADEIGNEKLDDSDR